MEGSDGPGYAPSRKNVRSEKENHHVPTMIKTTRPLLLIASSCSRFVAVGAAALRNATATAISVMRMPPAYPTT
jgi:hypothetical protein